ncbi:MAG: ABC transporter ATP-binding protein [Pseudomonadota bacterium]
MSATSTRPPKLELIGLRKEYDDGAVVAVDGVDLALEAGETMALLGPSGCGKSTTLNMIVGLETPSAGDILIDGVSVVDQPAGKRNVGLVFQDYAVFTHMTVEKNLAFGLEVRGAPRSEVRARVAETAELLGLGAMLKERAERLGGSELQRVAIGRTLVTKPSLLLLDEPLSNLETEMRASMRRELRRLQSEIGLTIIYVTHDQIEALSLAQRIAVMSAGKLRQCDLTATVFDQPAHTFVAGFIGSPPMNLVAGALEGAGESLEFVHGAFRTRAPLPAAAPPESGRVILGMRPDAIRLGAADGGMVASVTSIELRGPEAVIGLDVDGVALTAVAASGERPEEGARVGVDLDPARLVLFSADSHRNLTAPLEEAAR